jgi:hypothetical protein
MQNLGPRYIIAFTFTSRGSSRKSGRSDTTNESESEEMSRFAHDFVLEEIISRYGTGKNYNVMSEGRLEVLSRANELSRRVSADLLQKVEDLARRAKEIIDMFDRIYEVAKEEGYPIDEILRDKERLKEFLRM